MDRHKKEQLRKEYEIALLCRSLSNLSGLVYSLSQAMKPIQEEASELGQGIEYVNNHPIVRVYLEQMNSLCTAGYALSYQTCREKSQNIADNSTLSGNRTV